MSERKGPKLTEITAHIGENVDLKPVIACILAHRHDAVTAWSRAMGRHSEEMPSCGRHPLDRYGQAGAPLSRATAVFP